MLMLVLGGTDATGAPTLNFSATAYGTSAKVLGGVVEAGPSAAIGLGCTADAHAFGANTLAGVTVGNLLDIGAVHTRTFTNGNTVTSQSEVASASLLGGLIQVGAVKVVSSTTYTGTTFTESDAGTTIASLSINGQPVVIGTGSSSINVAGIGTLTIDNETSATHAHVGGLAVTGIDLEIGQNSLGIPEGLQIVVGHVDTAIADAPIQATLSGASFATVAKVGNLVYSGPGWQVGMCAGTGGHTLEDSTLGLDVPGVATVGALRDTIEGKVTGTKRTGEATSRVADVNLLGGLIQATVVKADVTLSRSGGVTTTDYSGSHLLGLSINGQSYPAVEPANTVVQVIPGIYVILNRVFQDSKGAQVCELEVVVKGSNRLGLPLSTNIEIAVAGLSAS